MHRMPLIMVLLVIVTAAVKAQEGSPGQQVISYMESFALYNPESDMIAEISDELDYLLENRVDINNGSEQEISRLFFLTIFQVRSMMEYIRTKGAVISIEEIAYIPGFDNELAKLIAPFINLDNRVGIRRPPFNNGRLLINYISKPSYHDPESPGHPFRLLAKANYKAGNFSTGITVEKDQGEVLLGRNPMVDFLSGYVMIEREGFLRRIILGDMRVRLGQGLLTWTGFSAGPTPLNPMPMKGLASITPYSSTDENNFFRGAGITGGNDRHLYMLYLSANRIDATLEQSGQGDGYVVTSLYDAGLHNTLTTMAKRDVLTEYSAGLSYNLNMKRFHTGLSMAATAFSIPLIREKSTENYFDFSGKENFSVSIDHSILLNRFYLYGEQAWNPGGGFALLQGVRGTPAPGFALNILYTGIMRGYNSFHGMANGRETVNNFRETVLANISLEPFRDITLTSGLLYSRELWFGQYGSAPGTSLRFKGELGYMPSENITITTAFTHMIADVSSGPDRGLRSIRQTSQSNLRVGTLLMPSDRLQFQSRIEIIGTDDPGISGYLLYTGIRYTLSSAPLSLISRIYVWSTRDFDSRIYAWEDDLLYSSSVVPYYYSGSRSYIILSWGGDKRVSVRLKYGYSMQTGDSAEELCRSEFKLQMRVRL